MILSLVYCPQMPATILPRRWFGRFLLRRIAKIYPLHLLTLLATIGLVVLAAFRHYHFHATNTDYTAWSAIANVFLLHAFGVTHQLSWNAASWSVSAEWFAYLVLFVPMVRLLRRVPLAWVIALALSMWCGLVLFAAFGLHTSIAEITYRGVLRILPEFICGYALFRIIEIAKPRRGDVFWMIGISRRNLSVLLPRPPFPAGSMHWLGAAGALLGRPVSRCRVGKPPRCPDRRGVLLYLHAAGVFPDRHQSVSAAGGYPAYRRRWDCAGDHTYRPGLRRWSSASSTSRNRSAKPSFSASMLAAVQQLICKWQRPYRKTHNVTVRREGDGDSGPPPGQLFRKLTFAR